MAWCIGNALPRCLRCCTALQTTWAQGLFIVGVFAVDAINCFSVFLLGRTSDSGDDPYESSTADTLECCLARLVVFPLLTLVAYLVYRRKAASSPLVRLQREESTAARSPLLTARREEEGAPQAMAIPLVSTGGNNGSSLTCSTASSDGGAGGVANGAGLRPISPEQQAFNIKQEHTLLMKQAASQRTYVVAFMFLVCIGMALYNGIKCVSFHYDPGKIQVQAVMLCSVLLFVNLEFFMLRSFLLRVTEEKGELVPQIHMHPLYFETGLKCHYCDICHETMKLPHYAAFRCRTCDFDLCPRCYKRKDQTNARGYGAQAIRRDGEQLTTWTYFVRIVKLAMEFWRTALLAFVSLIAVQSMQIWTPHIQGSIFDGIIQQLQDPSSGAGRTKFFNAIVLYTIVNALQAGLGGLKSLSQELVSRQLACSVRLKLFKSIIRMDISFFDSMHTGQLTSRLTNDASQMVQPLNTLLNDLVANVILLAGGMCMAFVTQWKLSMLALTVVPPITYTYRVYATWARQLNRSIQCALGEANTTSTEAIQNIRTVRGFSTEALEGTKYEDSIGTALQHGKANAYAAGSVNAFSTYLNLGTAVVILWYGGDLVCNSLGQELSLGKLVTFQLYWTMMNNAFISLGNVFNDLIRSSSAAERVCSLIDARPDVDPDAGEPVKPGDLQGHLQLESLEFWYRTRPENIVLKSVNLDMRPSTRTALVGKSGGGKSTLVHMLMRFYEPTAGRILLDGRDIKELSSKSVRKCCGFVSQDTQLFAASVEDNLTYGLYDKPHQKPPHEDIVEACKRANAHEFIMKMEEEYETRIGEKGMLLSGGQRQRLAIARCFLRKPKLLFLDEATSALDTENEGIVQDSIDTLMDTLQCTVVLIAHRLSTVISAHQIAVVHEGNIVEKGTHDELVAGRGIYARLVERQMSRDASAVVQEKKKDSSKGSPQKQVQTEIDEIFAELEKEKAGGLDFKRSNTFPMAASVARAVPQGLNLNE